jgi:hypothetical protein
MFAAIQRALSRLRENKAHRTPQKPNRLNT